MAHFGSSQWPDGFGRTAGLESAANVAQPLTTQATSTEGTDKLTFTVLQTGQYLVSANIKVTVASDAATTDVVVAQVAYNDGSAVAAVSIGQLGVTPGTINAKTLNAESSQLMVIKAVAGTTITITALHTVSGAKTVGSSRYNFTIARL